MKTFRTNGEYLNHHTYSYRPSNAIQYYMTHFIECKLTTILPIFFSFCNTDILCTRRRCIFYKHVNPNLIMSQVTTLTNVVSKLIVLNQSMSKSKLSPPLPCIITCVKFRSSSSFSKKRNVFFVKQILLHL